MPALSALAERFNAAQARQVRVVSLVPNSVRDAVEAAIGAQSFILHADDVARAQVAIRSHCPQFLLFSPCPASSDRQADVTRLVRSAPPTVPVAVLCDQAKTTPGMLLELGACGVQRVVDLADREGWGKLRQIVNHPNSEVATKILAAISAELGQTTTELRTFFDVVVRDGPSTPTVRRVAGRLSITPSSLVSRFVRSGLPSPKRYLVASRLLYVAALFDQREMTVGNAAYRLNYASPQSLGRHLRIERGITPGEFRERCSFVAELDRFISSLVRPYNVTLHRFNPFGEAKRR